MHTGIKGWCLSAPRTTRSSSPLFLASIEWTPSPTKRESTFPNFCSSTCVNDERRTSIARHLVTYDGEASVFALLLVSRTVRVQRRKKINCHRAVFLFPVFFFHRQTTHFRGTPVQRACTCVTVPNPVVALVDIPKISSEQHDEPWHREDNEGRDK